MTWMPNQRPMPVFRSEVVTGHSQRAVRGAEVRSPSPSRMPHALVPRQAPALLQSMTVTGRNFNGISSETLKARQTIVVVPPPCESTRYTKARHCDRSGGLHAR
jgi:hypothetical protein